jgi:hypothetical protein
MFQLTVAAYAMEKNLEPAPALLFSYPKAHFRLANASV